MTPLAKIGTSIRIVFLSESKFHLFGCLNCATLIDAPTETERLSKDG